MYFCTELINSWFLFFLSIAQLCLTLWDPMDYAVHGILQPRILEWVTFPFYRGSSQARNQIGISWNAYGFFINWAIRDALIKPTFQSGMRRQSRAQTCGPGGKERVGWMESSTDIHRFCCCCCCQVVSVVSDSVRPHRRQPTRLPCPWDSPGKNTGVGCHFLLQCMKVKSDIHYYVFNRQLVGSHCILQGAQLSALWWPRLGIQRVRGRHKMEWIYV